MDADLSQPQTFEKLGIALGLGLLIGMQRERTDSRLAGIRTFPLVTMFGTVTALLALRFGGWIMAAGFLGLLGLVIAGNFATTKMSPDPGVTTEMAIFLMFGVGAYLVSGYALVALALVGTIAMLLHLKPEMHSFARKIGEKDFKAIMQFVLITLVILPILPNQDYGPYHALNPYKIWLMVVLIVGIKLAAYVGYKFLGTKGGNLVLGTLGGLISSTATTVDCAQRTRESPEASPTAALVVTLASAVVYVRILIIAGAVAPQMLPGIAGPIGAMFGLTSLIVGGTWLAARKERLTMSMKGNPTELKSALIFGAIFVVVLVAVPAAKQYFGTKGFYAVSALSGLVDVDAITLSTLQSGQKEQSNSTLAWRVILVASLANLVFKGAVAAVLGSRKFFARVAVLFGAVVAAGVLIIWLWPEGQNAARSNDDAAATENSR